MKKLIIVGLILPLFFLPQPSEAFIGAWIAKKPEVLTDIPAGVKGGWYSRP